MDNTNSITTDPRARLQILGAQITATRKQLEELEAQFDATFAELANPAKAKGAPTGAAATTSGKATAREGSAVTRVLAWLGERPGKAVPAAAVVTAFAGSLQPQSVRDALRRLTLDTKSGVAKPSRGEYMLVAGAALGPGTGKSPAARTAAKKKGGHRGDLADLVREIVRENPKGLPAAEIAAAVASRSVRRITNKEVNDQLARLRKTPGDLGIEATGEPRKMIYTPRGTASATEAAPPTTSSESSEAAVAQA